HAGLLQGWGELAVRPAGHARRDNGLALDPDVTGLGAKRHRDVFAEGLQAAQPGRIDEGRRGHPLTVEDVRLVVSRRTVATLGERETAEPSARREQGTRPAMSPEPAGIAASLAVDAQAGARE